MIIGPKGPRRSVAWAGYLVQVSRRLCFFAVGTGGLLTAIAFADSVAAQTPITSNGPPQQVIPRVGELGMPNFTLQIGTIDPFGGADGGNDDAAGTDTGGVVNSGSSNIGSSDALNTMISQPWGITAINNAQAIGVNPTALAATCVLESGCAANTGSGGAQGVFQMFPAAFQEGLQAALSANPALASQIAQGSAGMNDPVTEAVAASGYLMQASQALQNAGVSNPTVLDVRSYYEFRPKYGIAIAQADPSTTMSSLLPANFLSSNGSAVAGICAEQDRQCRRSSCPRLGDSMRITVSLLFAAALLLTGVSVAGVRKAVAPLPGLACMSVNMTQAQAMDPSFVVPIRAEPTATSPAVGQAAAIVLRRSPKVERNGFLAAVLFNGRPGWIAASQVRPWKNPGANGQQCVPTRMSDGSIGFVFR